ncbi:Ig-like domain-containing protein [Kaarinaea lacus]
MNAFNYFRAFVCLIILGLNIAGCSNSSGGGNNSGTDEINNSSLNSDQQAFSESIYPLLNEHCSSCHSEKSTRDIELAQFAHGDVVLAYSVVVNRDLVDRDSPDQSRFVEKLADDKHFCWSNCTDNSGTMATEVSHWNDLTANSSGGNTINDPKSSVQAFSQTLHPLMIQHCAGCHDGSTNFSAFASPDAETAHEITLNRALANLNDPSDSELIKYLADKEHNCWSDCGTNAQRTQSAISDWKSLLDTNANDDAGNNNPIAVNDNYTTSTSVPLVTGNVLLNDVDADSDTLAISAWETTSRQGGRVTNNLNGTFNYNPPNGFFGNDSFLYTITDGKGGFDSATVAIAVSQNLAPTAVDDTVKTNQNTPVTMNDLLANDINTSNTPLTITSVDNRSQNGGIIIFNGANSVTYTPPTNLTGIDRFNYTVSNNQGFSTAQVSVDINAQPIAVSDAVYTYVDTAANTGNILSNDQDTNGDTLFVSAFDSASAQAGAVSYNGDGSFTYDPPNNFQGNDSFDYIIADGRGGSATATVFISVINQVLRDDNRFLAFLDQTAPLFTEDRNTARAYYRAVDPLDQRTTLDAWRQVNGFNIGADAFAVYINNNDLGFARRMFVRTDPITGIVSSYVENYPTLNDALNETNLIATVAMEYTVPPGQDPLDREARRYTTFYVFDGNDNRDLGADLDGRGFKFIPGLCNTCHGGRPQALVNGVYPDSGDTGAGFIPWDLDTYLFEDNTAAVSRAQQENQFKIFNETVLRTDPTSAQREVVEGWYGGPNLRANAFNGGFVPQGWLPPNAPANATQLYIQVVAPSCRACHIMRGSSVQNDIDFASYDKFISYKHRIETLVYDESTMPLALRTFDRFWANRFIPETLAEFLDSSKILEDDELLTPGRPIANPGPFREEALGRVDLNGNGSLFTDGATAFSWTLVSRPAESIATIQNANQANAFFVADVPGDYIAQLIVNDGIANTPPSPPGEVFIRVSGALRNTSFVSDIAPIFNECAVCHLGFDNPRFNNLGILYNNVINFVNQNDPVNSPILTKPSGLHHAGGTITGFESTNSEKYTLILRWILEGAPDN